MLPGDIKFRRIGKVFLGDTGRANEVQRKKGDENASAMSNPKRIPGFRLVTGKGYKQLWSLDGQTD